MSDPRLLVGTSTADDAGVFLIQPGLALVQTVDLLTPVVPDAYTFGQIAAANSLSDVYAMGGEPLTAMNVLGYPAAGRKDWLVEILHGALDKCTEAGVCVVGGHTFNDPEIKFGLAVTGVIDPQQIVTNARAESGDILVLTKPLGTGTLSQALMTTDNIPEEFLRQGIAAMRTLNSDAGRLMVAHGVRSATDITGFGFIGHLQEMVLASNCAAKIFIDTLPILPGALDMIQQGVLNPGIAMNEASFGPYVRCDLDATQPLVAALLNLLYESQTSGGLLLAVPADRIEKFCAALSARGIRGAVVGEVLQGPPGIVFIGHHREDRR